MISLKNQPTNVFAGALDAASEDGARVTRTEFMEVVSSLTRRHGRVTGSLVQQIREDWEALGPRGQHPATPEAQAAYRAFVVKYGPLALLELLNPNRADAAA
jgi:uncharacterized protein with PIN domain